MQIMQEAVICQQSLTDAVEPIPDFEFDLGNCSRHGPTSHIHVVERISW